MSKNYIIRILTLLVVLTIYSCKEEKKEENKVSQKEEKIPTYSFAEFEKELKHRDGNVYVINFWATWCQPCIEELPYFERLNEEEDVKVILVSLDFLKTKKSRLIPFVEKNNIQSEVILLNDPDSNAWIPQVNPDWEGAIPATLIYKNENSNFYDTAFSNYEELKLEVEKIQ